MGFVLVRDGVHIVAYAKALEKLSRIDGGKLLPIPDIGDKRVPPGGPGTRRGVSIACSIGSVPRITRVRERSGTGRARRMGASWRPPGRRVDSYASHFQAHQASSPEGELLVGAHCGAMQRAGSVY